MADDLDVLCFVMSQLYRDDIDGRTNTVNQYSIVLCTNDEYRAMMTHDMRSLIKCCETLAFLVRDAAHITPHNFTSCVHAIRTFVEASVNGGTVIVCYIFVLGQLFIEQLRQSLHYGTVKYE